MGVPEGLTFFIVYVPSSVFIKYIAEEWENKLDRLEVGNKKEMIDQKVCCGRRCICGGTV